MAVYSIANVTLDELGDSSMTLGFDVMKDAVLLQSYQLGMKVTTDAQSIARQIGDAALGIAKRDAVSLDVLAEVQSILEGKEVVL